MTMYFCHKFLSSVPTWWSSLPMTGITLPQRNQGLLDVQSPIPEAISLGVAARRVRFIFIRQVVRDLT
jgi:hypothetical protein